MKRFLVCSVLLVLGSGCATAPPRPSVHAYPARGQGTDQMSRDTTECQAWAHQQTGYDPVTDTAKGAAIGTLLGGALGAGGGAAVGAATGTSVGKGAATGAVIGGVAGGVTGGAYKYSKSKQGYDQAFAACMSGRGYATGAGAPATPAPPPPVAVAAPPPPAVAPPPAQPAAVMAVPPAPPAAVVVKPRHVHVPPGHYPPPGHCRVWHPGRPPGHQPRPAPCNQITAPPGAFILYNGVAWDAGYNWRVHAHRHPGTVPPVIVEVTARR